MSVVGFSSDGAKKIGETVRRVKTSPLPTDTVRRRQHFRIGKSAPQEFSTTIVDDNGTPSFKITSGRVRWGSIGRTIPDTTIAMDGDKVPCIQVNIVTNTASILLLTAAELLAVSNDFDNFRLASLSTSTPRTISQTYTGPIFETGRVGFI